MKLLLRIYLSLLCAAGAVGLWTCSPNQNTVSADLYHNTTAHYNGYFYAKEKIHEIQKTILKSLDDDPNDILRLFPKLDTTLARTYRSDTEEAIKMASISIQRHPNSRWLHDNYLLVGLARLYDCNYQDAIQTFKYINTKSLDTDLRHKALLSLIRTFTEQGEFAKAQETFEFLEKEKLTPSHKKDLCLEKAYYYQLRVDYDNMVRNLTDADSLLTRADRKGRIYFIIGQVYQELGFGSEAYNYYRKCLSTNPEYEIDFYARLNMAQVARLDNSKNLRIIRKQFQKLLSDSKNQEFRDKIYYELGVFEQKQGNMTEAIDQYKLSAHAGKNKRIQGNAYLRVGEIYFDSLKKFSLAKAYYDSAVSSLPKDMEGYEAISKRHQVLDQFVLYTGTISWQDSLLYMASLDSSILRKKLDSTLTARLKKDEVKKKKRRRVSSDGGSSNQSSFFQTESTSTTDWYFGNPAAVSSGQTEFQRIWGTIALEDNWRRSSKTATAGPAAIGPEPTVAPVETGPEQTPEEIAAAASSKAIAKVFGELPLTQEQKKVSLGKIEEAYFKLGDLYYLQLQEKENAEKSYNQLLERFDESVYEPEVLYKLYLIHKEKGDGMAEVIASRLKSEHPGSTFTKILLNPDYLKETSVAQEKQKMIYKEAYAEFQKNNLRRAQEKIKQAREIGETTFTPQLDLLQILITGKTEDATRYQYELGEFIKKYQDPKLNAYAENLLASSKTFIERTERARGIRFVASFDEPHYFVVVHRIQDKSSADIATKLESLSAQFFKAQKLETINLIFNDQYALTFVGDLPGQPLALDYNGKFETSLSKGKPFSTLNFHNFVITKDNFNIFYRNKALDEYLSFFDRYYKK